MLSPIIIPLLASLVTGQLAGRGLAGRVVTKCTESNAVALTFDDGPSQYLRIVSDAITAAGGKGTFFFNGENYVCIYDEQSVSNVKYALANGHQIASHTWSHPHLTTLNRSQIELEFHRIDDAIEKITGVKPAFMRPPYGEYNDLVVEVAKDRGQALATWDFDCGDSIGATPDQSKNLYDEVVKKRPSNILALNHDVHQTTAEIVVPHAVKVLTAAGYKLVTLAECVGEQPYLSIGKPSARDASWICGAGSVEEDVIMLSQGNSKE